MKTRLAACVLALAFFAAPLAAEAQPSRKVYRIGLLCSAYCAPGSLAAFRSGLRDLQYLEGDNLAIEYRYADEDPDRHIDLARELVGLKVDVIIAPSDSVFLAVIHQRTTIPVVAIVSGPEVSRGQMATLARLAGMPLGSR